MPVSPTTLNGTQNTPVLRSSGVSKVDLSEAPKIEQIKTRFTNNGEYETKRNTLLSCLNSILGKTYSFDDGDLSIETIFNNNPLPNNDKICNAGKKAYAYYLKEVLQKLNLLNQHIIKGQDALNALQACTNEDQIENYKTILEIQDELVKKYLDDFNNYTVVQTLSTTRYTTRNTIDNTSESTSSVDSVEINYATRGKIWDEDGNEKTSFQDTLNALDSLQALRSLTTVKENGAQTITTTLTNKHTGATTNLNDEFGFNVVDKKITIVPTSDEEEREKQTTPIALFDELTLLEKLKYIHVYYNNRDNYSYEFYHYPEDLKSGVPCMSRAELEKFVHDTNTSATTKDPEGNDDELEALGIIPSEANKPKTDLVEPGAVELFYVGYLEDSMGAINALAAFMEIKSVSLITQITQQSYRIKALKTYLKMLEFGLQELNASFKENTAISTKTYLAIKYAAANQTRTLVNINGEDYIVMQLDGAQETGDYEHYNLSDNNAYIYVKATEAGIDEFLGLQWDAVDLSFQKLANNYKEFTSLNNKEIIYAYDSGTIYEGGTTYANKIYDFFYKKVTMGNSYKITTDGNKYRYDSTFEVFISTKAERVYKKDIDRNIAKAIENKKLAYLHYDNIIYQKQTIREGTTLKSSTGNILFAKFDDNDQATEHLPKELETAKVKMDTLLQNVGSTSLNWKNATLTEDEIDDGVEKAKIWPKFVEQWQNVCQTAIENIGSQIESVNKTIKSLRSKIDTFDSSANRFRDKFYSTTMTVLNKIS